MSFCLFLSINRTLHIYFPMNWLPRHQVTRLLLCCWISHSWRYPVHRTIGGHWNAQSQPRGSRYQGGVTLHSCWDWRRRCGSTRHLHTAATSCLFLQHEVQTVVDEGRHVQTEEVLSNPCNQRETFIPWICVLSSSCFPRNNRLWQVLSPTFLVTQRKQHGACSPKSIGYFSTSEKDTPQPPRFTMEKSSSVSCTMLRTWQRQMTPECNCLTSVRRSR